MFKLEKNIPQYEDYKHNNELIDLIEAYNTNNQNFYDFRENFITKLGKKKHLTHTEIVTLTGLASTVKDKDLQELLYKTIIEELVLIVTSME